MEAGSSHAIAAESNMPELVTRLWENPYVPPGVVPYLHYSRKTPCIFAAPNLAAIVNFSERSVERAAHARCRVCK